LGISMAQMFGGGGLNGMPMPNMFAGGYGGMMGAPFMNPAGMNPAGMSPAGMNPMMGGYPMMNGMPGMMPPTFNPAMYEKTADLSNSLAEESMKISDKATDQTENQDNDASKVAANCAACDRFATEMLDISSDAYPGGGNVDADKDLCTRVSPEFSASCEAYVGQAGGLGDVDMLLSEDRSAMCQHLEQCQQLGSFMSTGSEQKDDDEDDDEKSSKNDSDDDDDDDESDDAAFLSDDDFDNDDDEDENQRRRNAAKLGTNGDALDDLTKNMKQSQSIQMMNAKQMSDMELMNNALKLHDMTMYPALHPLPCIDRDDPECATSGLLHGMSYLMMANSLANGGLDNGGANLAMLASAYPNNPHQNA